MLTVVLQNDWYDPDGKYWSKRGNPHQVPEELEEFISSTAEINGKRKGKKEAKNVVKERLEVSKAELEARAEKERAENLDKELLAAKQRIVELEKELSAKAPPPPPPPADKPKTTI